MVFAVGGVGEFRAAAATDLGGPGVHTGEVEVLAVAVVVESVQRLWMSAFAAISSRSSRASAVSRFSPSSTPPPGSTQYGPGRGGPAGLSAGHHPV